MSPYDRETLARIRAKIEIKKENGIVCHIWTGSLCKGNNPTIAYNGRMAVIKRLLYRFHNGNMEIPRDKIVINTCNNKICVNPEHLTIADRPRRKSRTNDRNDEYVVFVKGPDYLNKGCPFLKKVLEFELYHCHNPEIIRQANEDHEADYRLLVACCGTFINQERCKRHEKKFQMQQDVGARFTWYQKIKSRIRL